MTTDKESLYLRIIQEIPEHLPEAIAIEGAEDCDGGGGGVEVHPGLPEALHDELRLRPQGHHPNDPPGIHHRQPVAEIKGDELHLFGLYNKNWAKGSAEPGVREVMVKLPTLLRKTFCGFSGVMLRMKYVHDLPDANLVPNDPEDPIIFSLTFLLEREKQS
jgi:hypothetical protein